MYIYVGSGGVNNMMPKYVLAEASLLPQKSHNCDFWFLAKLFFNGSDAHVMGMARNKIWSIISLI